MTEAAYWEDFNICTSCVIHFVPQPPVSQVSSMGPWAGWQVELLPTPKRIKPPRIYPTDEDLDKPFMQYHQLKFEALSGEIPVQAACTFIVPYEKRPPKCFGYDDISRQPQTIEGVTGCAAQFGYIKIQPQSIESPWDMAQTATALLNPAQKLTIRLFANAFFRWFTGQDTGFSEMPIKGSLPARTTFSRTLDDRSVDLDDDASDEEESDVDGPTILARLFPPGTDFSRCEITFQGFSRRPSPSSDERRLIDDGRLTEDEQRRSVLHMEHVLMPRSYDPDASAKIRLFIGAHQQIQRASWVLKEIPWKRQDSDELAYVRILVDHAGGPCSLQVLVNVLILRGSIRIDPALHDVSMMDVYRLIRQYMQDKRIPRACGGDTMAQFRVFEYMYRAMTHPTTLDAGFSSTWDIKDTRRIGELGVMELCGVRVCHGRLPGPDDKGYHQLLEVAWVSRAESLVRQWREAVRNPEMTEHQPETVRKLEKFLRATDANQVTEKGRQALAHELSRGAVQAFWNESGLRVIHYSTDLNEARTPAGLKSNLFELVFDTNEAVVWKRVAPKGQPSEFFDAQFNLVAPAAKTNGAKKRKKTNKANNETKKRLSNRSSTVMDPAPASRPSAPPASRDQGRSDGNTNDPRPASPEEDKPKRKSLRIQSMGHVVKKKVSRIFRGGRQGE